MNILFVCTGNICRSPTGEAVLRKQAGDTGLSHLTIDSCGTHSYHVGDPPDDRAQNAGKLRGYDFSGQQARQLNARDFETFDLILAMDRGHHDLLLAAAPTRHVEKVRLFLEFAPGTGRQDVPDPYYGGSEDYELALDLIEAGCRGILAELAAQKASP